MTSFTLKLLINSQNLPLQAFAHKIILLKGVIFLFLSPAQCLRFNWIHYSVPRKRLSISSTNKLGYCQGAEKFTKFNKIRFSWSKGRGDCLEYWTVESEKVKSFSRVRLFVTPWAVAYQASLSMGFSRQSSWSGLLFPSPGDLPNPGIKPGSPALQTLYHLSHQGSQHWPVEKSLNAE